MGNNFDTSDITAIKNYRRTMALKRQRRNKIVAAILLTVLTMALVLTFSISYGSIKSDANSGFKYFKSITVDCDDTLWAIAENNIDYDHYKNVQAYIDEVKHINHIEDENFICSGQKIVIPYYSSEFVY